MRTEKEMLRRLKAAFHSAETELVVAKRKLTEQLATDTRPSCYTAAFETLLELEAILGLAPLARRTEAEVEEHPGEFTEELLSRLVRGADDKWSGRGNDSRRIAFDALTRVIREVLGVC